MQNKWTERNVSTLKENTNHMWSEKQSNRRANMSFAYRKWYPHKLVTRNSPPTLAGSGPKRLAFLSWARFDLFSEWATSVSQIETEHWNPNPSLRYPCQIMSSASKKKINSLSTWGLLCRKKKCYFKWQMS